MTELEVAGRHFRVARLDPRKSFHVLRRVAPLGGGLKEAVPYLLGKPLDADDLGRVVEVFEPLAAALARLPEADVDYVLDTCMAVAQVNDRGGWAPVQAGGSLMFDWITTPMMLQVVVRVLRENLQGFFSDEAPTS